jgi:large subunit ribosomal protein L24
MPRSMRIRRDDEVVVISGKDRGKTGRVLRVDRTKERVYVAGLNIIKRHQRPSQLNPNAEAGVIEREGPIHVSNVALRDPKDKKPTRVKTIEENGRRLRASARTGAKL